MVLETELLPFTQWIGPAVGRFFAVAALLVMAILVVSFIVAGFRNGPRTAVRMVGRTLGSMLDDVFGMSPRRVWALTWLALKESIRRRIVVVFVLFIVLLLFAGWYLDPGSAQPARLYLSFVLTATGYLILLLALFLSVFSLPNDLKSRTVHTVVTKPVRSSEIVLGRMLGFTLLGTLLLGGMCFISYFFVVRGLSHTHEVIVDSLTAVEQGPSVEPGTSPLIGRSTKVNNHFHNVYVEPGGTGQLEIENSHWHPVTGIKSGGKMVYQVGGPEEMFAARVPVYGKLRFTDRAGKDAEKGVNVGDEWTYRSFIEGGSLASATWTFDGISKEKFPEGLPLELTLGVFRTYKGNINKGIAGSLSIRNPETQRTVEARIFTAKEFETDSIVIPSVLQTPEGVKVDLFEDLVAGGKVEIIIRCLNPAQYFGMAQPDVYLRATDSSFELNFIKGYFGIWMQMVLVVCFGVMYSTFLSGPIAMLATLGTLIGGYFSGFMGKLASGETYGGGPVESFIRIITQKNLVTELEPGFSAIFAVMCDAVLQIGLGVMAVILPNFGAFSCSDYVANGFNVPFNWILQHGLTTLAYFALLFLVGHLFFKSREVAR